MQKNRSLQIYKSICYLLAGIILGLGLIAGISLIASAGNIQNVLMPLQFLGNEAIVNLITPLVQSVVSGLGVFVLIVCLVLSLLLFVAGCLLGHIALQEMRLGQLEVQMGKV